MFETSCAPVRLITFLFLVSLWMGAAVPVESFAQEDTTRGTPADSVIRPEPSSASPTDSAGRPDTTDQLPADGVSSPDTSRDASADSLAGQDATSQVPADSAARTDTTVRAVSDSLDQSADSLQVSGSAADDSLATGQADVSSRISYENSEVEAVARVLVAVEELRRNFHGRQGLPEDTSSTGNGLHAQFRAEVHRVLEQHGITLEFYRQIIREARERPTLRKRLISAAAEIREAE